MSVNENDAVKLTGDGDHWAVEVYEAGELRTTKFDLQAHAESFASGQRHRLGICDGETHMSIDTAPA